MKTSTNLHWDKRAEIINDKVMVNIADIYQRELENELIICPYLKKDMKILEVGCGNGYSTSNFRDLVGHVDAMDISENMIKRARRVFGQKKNRFFVDNILKPKHLTGFYDLVVCVRVLINLRNLKEQKTALRNLAMFVRKKGLLILVEGFKDGFIYLNEMRRKMEMPPVKPAKINFYSFTEDLKPCLEKFFKIKKELHLGSYDFLTRLAYPLLVGPGNAKHNTVFHEKFMRLASKYNPESFAKFSRIRGYILVKK
ncbi:MAG: class I SAM-dependent methyltransferase [Candidatus Omnitrophica bacterium]|nr:class I SAM-dependent methyltransferase [Candidatus Omnitrophota bacterium]